MASIRSFSSASGNFPNLHLPVPKTPCKTVKRSQTQLALSSELLPELARQTEHEVRATAATVWLQMPGTAYMH